MEGSETVEVERKSDRTMDCERKVDQIYTEWQKQHIGPRPAKDIIVTYIDGDGMPRTQKATIWGVDYGSVLMPTFKLWHICPACHRLALTRCVHCGRTEAEARWHQYELQALDRLAQKLDLGAEAFQRMADAMVDMTWVAHQETTLAHQVMRRGDNCREDTLG